MRLLALSFSLACVSLVSTSGPAHAMWGRTPVGAPVVTAIGDQHRPVSIADGEGGAIFVFADLRDGGSYDLWAQRINRAGNRVWSPNGVPVCRAAGLQELPQLVSDGAGGVIITWEDARSGNFDVYAQRLDGTGLSLWAENGVAVSSAGGDQVDPAICADNAGGAYIAWTDYRSAATSDVYAQRIDAAGVAQLAPNGVALCSAAFDQDSPVIVSDGGTGAIAIWNDFRNGNNADLYAGHLLPIGIQPWGGNGVLVANGAGDQLGPVAVPDGAHGAMVSWFDSRSGQNDIYAQRLSPLGARLWTPAGEPVCVATNDQSFPAVASDGMGGMFVTWEDARRNEDDIYVQHVDSTAFQYWTTNGLLVCDAPGVQSEPQVVADSHGGVFIAWQDARYGNYDQFAQRLDVDGLEVWQHNGLPVCVNPGPQVYPSFVSDGAGGCIVIWEDGRNLLVDLYAQRILPNGVLGSSEPVITSITDQPADEGRHVLLTWNAALTDSTAPSPLGMYYVLSRHPGGNWTLVDSLEATGAPVYSRTGETSIDSLPGITTLRTAFRIETRTDDLLRSWTSAPDSGLSRDNIAPAVPVGFLVLDQGGNVARARWKPSGEPDFMLYKMYMGAESFFVPSEFTFRHTLTDSVWMGYVDPGFFVKLTAVDIHGNESDAAWAKPEVTVDAGSQAPALAFLSEPSPNPSHGAMSLRFGLPRDARVSLRLYDQQGRQVRVLADGPLPSGEHMVTWDGRDGLGREAAPGMYFVRARLDGRDLVQRVVRVR